MVHVMFLDRTWKSFKTQVTRLKKNKHYKHFIHFKIHIHKLTHKRKNTYSTRKR